MIYILKTGIIYFICAAIYRLGSQPVTTTFIDEFSAVLQVLTTYHSTIMIAGDFNIHCDVANDVYAAHFLNLQDAFGLQQHVDELTQFGHILDLIITAADSQLSNV